jgi:hypothetical protein
VNYVELAFDVALALSAAIFVGLFGFVLYRIKPFSNFERGIAALIWAFPLSVLLTMVLAYLDLPHIFLSLFGVPGLSVLVLPPEGSGAWRLLGGLLLAFSVFITLVTTGVLAVGERGG